jgi:competence protein ComEA
MQNDSANSFLTFTKKEKRGTLVLLAVIISIFVCAKYIYPLIIKEEALNNTSVFAAVDSLREKQNDSQQNYGSNNYYNDVDKYHPYEKTDYSKPFTGKMFFFDPNTLDIAGWQRLGVKDKTIASIQKYIAKGGRFRQADDLRKVWGLRDDEKERLIPYARIVEQQQKKYASNFENNYEPYEKKIYEKKPKSIVDISLDDSVAFDGLPGIGGGYAKRILKYRNMLGGFYKIEQIAEVYGLPDSTFQKIKPFLKSTGANVRKININTATEDELKVHPYIRWQLAKVITEYKKQHGNYNSLDDLKKIMIIDENIFNKIYPYLTL